MHITTKALVLRTTDYKESDKILTLFTQDQGKLTASARGCRKKGSAIAAGCQLLAWSEMVLYDYQGRWAVKESATQRLFRGVRDDIQRLALGCYFAEVAELLAVEGLPSPELLSLTLNSLHALDKMPEKPLPLVKAAFEWKALALAMAALQAQSPWARSPGTSRANSGTGAFGSSPAAMAPSMAASTAPRSCCRAVSTS